MPRISVIIPVYNDAEYLDSALAGWEKQTYGDIEIICVNDASTDNSLDILNDRHEKDERFKVCSLERNSSAWMARKRGIEMASGEYIMFADADDEIDVNACAELLSEMEAKPVDILNFDTEIINADGLPKARVEGMERFMRPYDGELFGADVLTGCFLDGKYRFSLFNKLFASKICKKAIEHMADTYWPKGQDKLMYFIIAFFAESYRGISGKKYYKYFFGRGVTGHNRITLEEFEKYCSMALVAEGLASFLRNMGCAERYKTMEEVFRSELFNDCFARFENEVSPSDKTAAFDIMLKYWKTNESIIRLAERYFGRRDEALKAVLGAKSLKYDGRPVKTIAAYYHSLANGGAQRVTVQLANLWVRMGYNVIMLTDEEPSDMDYPLDASVKRIVVPHHERMNSGSYHERYGAIARIIKDYRVDAVVYHAWLSGLMLWDEITCKANGAAFIVHCHNIFSVQAAKGRGDFSSKIAPYRLADATVTLSRVDRAFWQMYCPNAIETINPFPDDTAAWKPHFETGNHDVLWLGRLGIEKNVPDALEIFKKAREKVKDARLHIVGSGKTERETTELISRIEKLKLQDCVTVHGFKSDVRSFYEKCAVFLITSSYEGYTLTLLESKVAGLPCVMYEMPYLTLCEGQRGMISVPQRNINMAAEALADILLDEEKRRTMGMEARSHVDELLEFDFERKWRDIFESVTQPHEMRQGGIYRLMLDTFITHYDVGARDNARRMRAFEQDIIDNAERRLIATEKRLKAIEIETRRSVAFRLERLFRKGMRSLKNDGVPKTLARTARKTAHFFKKKMGK